jgi:hypothetical protein
VLGKSHERINSTKSSSKGKTARRKKKEHLLGSGVARERRRAKEMEFIIADKNRISLLSRKKIDQ